MIKFLYPVFKGGCFPHFQGKKFWVVGVMFASVAKAIMRRMLTFLSIFYSFVLFVMK